jgi:1D-myo-inositol-tetrakisphosphate 5-kinase/inositol-polyphosphate multikinase
MDAKTAIPPTSRVGGHPGVSMFKDGFLLIEPTLAHEVSVYQSLTSNPTFAPSIPYILKPHETFRFEGKGEDGDLGVAREPPEEGKDKHCLYLQLRGYLEIVCVLVATIHSMVLENLSYRPLKPNTLNIKLGTALYDGEASEMEKTRMLRTFFEGCVRLTGFRVSNTQGLALSDFFVEIRRRLQYSRSMAPRWGRRATVSRSMHRPRQTASPIASR